MSTGLPSFPQTIPPNTVLGRSGIDAGPVQALPFGTLQNSTQVNDGTVSSGTATINVAAGPQHLLTVGGPIAIAFTGWPPAPIYAELELELVNGGANVTWPASINWLKGDGSNSTTFSTMGVTLNTVGTNFIIVWSRNAGATIWGRAA